MGLTAMTGTRITERHLQAVWFDDELRPRNLRDRAGRIVKVMHPGEWNQLAGPDFRGAVLAVGEDGQPVTGDVEVHLTPAGWNAHGHDGDPNYRNVIAHVTWKDGPPPNTLPPAAITICLGEQLDAGFTPEAIDTDAYPFRKPRIGTCPCHKTTGGNRKLSLRLLYDLGTRRLLGKASRIRWRLSDTEPVQLFYEETMRALGFGRNQDGFALVARLVPYAELIRQPAHAAAALTTAAGFCKWHHGNCRPNNAPELRLNAAATLFTATNVMSLASLPDLSPSACRRAVGIIMSGGGIGCGRSAAIVTNVIVPYALATGNANEVPDWLPPEDLSRVVRRTAHRLFGCDHNPRRNYGSNGLLIQGLLEMDHELCARYHPGCRDCPISQLRPAH